MIGRENSAR